MPARRRLTKTALTLQEINIQKSRGQLEFQSGAAARINRFTRLSLGKSCFLLSQGQALVSVKQSGCTKWLRLSSRGTNDQISLNDDGTTDVIVLEGTVEADQVAANNQPAGQPPQLSKLLEELNQRRDQLGNPEFKAVNETVQEQINANSNALIKAMKTNGWVSPWP